MVPSGASLRVKSGFYQGLEVALDRDWIVIGRGRSADLVIAEPTISRAHAAIGHDAQGFYVQDLAEPPTELTDRKTFVPYTGTLPVPDPERLKKLTVRSKTVVPG